MCSNTSTAVLTIYVVAPIHPSETDQTSWRNNALVYLMEDVGVFGRVVNPADALDFYTQCCSIEVNTKSAAVIASTFAAAGECPLTNKACVSPSTVRSTLSLMFSCGMYDYSGTHGNRHEMSDGLGVT